MMKTVRDSKMFSFKYMVQMITQDTEYERVKNELREKVIAGAGIIQNY
jgi:hypothetical protein